MSSDHIETSQDVKQPASSPSTEALPAAEEKTVQRDERTEDISTSSNTVAASTVPDVEAMETEGETPEQEDEHDSFVPRGTLLFLLVMLTGYALYWAYLWFIVVVERGAGGG